MGLLIPPAVPKRALGGCQERLEGPEENWEDLRESLMLGGSSGSHRGVWGALKASGGVRRGPVLEGTSSSCLVGGGAELRRHKIRISAGLE